jgi:hypothetical protein
MPRDMEFASHQVGELLLLNYVRIVPSCLIADRPIGRKGARCGVILSRG